MLRKTVDSGKRNHGIFIVGTGRCGTSLLATILDSHSNIAITPETHFVPECLSVLRASSDPETMLKIISSYPRYPELNIPFDTLRERFMGSIRRTPSFLVNCLYDIYAETHNKSRWGDNTPFYGFHMRRLQAITGGAKFIHIVRDGRDVALSVIPLKWGPNDIETAAQWWQESLRRIRDEARHLPFYMEIRYEDLILESETSLRKICAFVDEPYDASILEYQDNGARRLAQHVREVGPITVEERRASVSLIADKLDGSRVARWKKEFTSSQNARFMALAGDTLNELYPNIHDVH